MALTYGFYNSHNHDRTYDAEQVGQIFDGLITDGIYSQYLKGMQVTADGVSSNKVTVLPGRAWFDHTWTYIDANWPVALDPPESALSRYDAVVLDVNRNSSSRRNSIQVVKGAAASSPSKPSMSTGDAKHKRYPLCYIKRGPGQTVVRQADIEDVRGYPACPFVAAPVNGGFTVEDLLAQWSDQFELYILSKQSEWSAFQTKQENLINTYRREMETSFFRWMETEENKYDNWLEHLEIAWTNWFSHVQYVLDGDVAGHLQEQIDWIRKFSSIYVVDNVLYVPMSGASVSGKKLIFAQDH